MKKLTLLLLVASPLLIIACTPADSNNSSSPDSGESDGTKLNFQTIEKRGMSGINSPENIVINEEKEWANLWARIHSNQTPTPKLPQMNFSKETVVGVFLGTKNSGGYGIEIKKVTDTGKKIVVMVEEASPPKGAMVTMALTQPFHLVKIENPGKKPIEFKGISNSN